MAKATKTTERVEKVIYEDKDVVTVEMTPDEAHAVYSALWLMEMVSTSDPNCVALKDVQNALGVTLEFPIAKFRFDKDNCYNNVNTVYIHSRN